MTGEDVHADEAAHARENVIHEAGLFQGRLGFERAIILLEEGCSQFSNIHGLTHISFPKGDLTPAFEYIRQVLERENVGSVEEPKKPRRGALQTKATQKMGLLPIRRRRRPVLHGLLRHEGAEDSDHAPKYKFSAMSRM